MEHRHAFGVRNDRGQPPEMCSLRRAGKGEHDRTRRSVRQQPGDRIPLTPPIPCQGCAGLKDRSSLPHPRHRGPDRRPPRHPPSPARAHKLARRLKYLASVVMTWMENYLAQLGAWATVTQGAIFMIRVLAFRRGIIGQIGNALTLQL